MADIIKHCCKMFVLFFLQRLIFVSSNGLIPTELPDNGQLYVFAIPSSPSPRAIYVYMSSEMSANIQLHAPSINVNTNYRINRSSVKSVLSSGLSTVAYNNITNKSVYIQSDSDVNVHVLIYGSSYCDGFLATPLYTYSTEFYIFTINESSSTYEFLVSAIFDQTEVSILLRTPQGNVSFEGSFYRSGRYIRRTLNALEALQIQHGYDLTGTHVTSSKPITAISGSPSLSVRHGVDTVVDQILPVSRWKAIYLVAHLATGGISKVQIMSSTESNQIRINTKLAASLDTGEFYEGYLNSTSIWCIEANGPIAVVQAPAIIEPGVTGYPFMIYVSPVEDYLTNYVFEVPSMLSTSYLDIFIDSDHVYGLQLDGRAVLLTSIQTVTVPSLGKSYSAGRLLVSIGSHVITHRTNGVKFGAVLYGFGGLIAYGFSLGVSNGPACTPRCQNGGICVAENTCHCQHGFHGQACELGNVLTDRLKPHLFTTVDEGDGDFTNPLAWYSEPSFSDSNKVCFVKVHVQNSDQNVLVEAKSSTVDGMVYGNFTAAPIDSSSGIQGQSRCACVEVRCPFATINGTYSDIAVKITLDGYSAGNCHIRYHNPHLANLTVQTQNGAADEIDFVLEVNKNYGPYYGIYMAIGKRDKAKFIAEHKCNSGREYDYRSYNPSLGVLADYVC